jgi:hypothetical protein
MPDARAVLELWDRCEREHPVDRVLTILAAFTAAPRSTLASLPVHRRDALLLSSRILAFGTHLEGIAICPACGCKVDASMSLPNVPATLGEDGGTIKLNGELVPFRMPDSRDLAEVARVPDPISARKVLLARCQLTGPSEETVESAIDQELAHLYDASAVELTMECPECRHNFMVPVDIALFLWDELIGYATSLVDEVDALATRYGWAEADILAMPESRRRFYLERYA